MTEDTKSFAGAEKRHAQWESMGCPVTRGGQCIRDYNDMYKQRFNFVNNLILDQAVRHLRVILCPACTKTGSDGRVDCSILFITIEDDVMTVWPAMGHFTCHHCGFEEWHPMKHDPRATAAAQQQMMGGGGGGGMAGGLGNAMGGNVIGQNSARMQQMQNAYNRALQQSQSQAIQQQRDEYRKASQRSLKEILGGWM